MQSVTAAQLKAIAGPGARSDLVSAIVRGWPTAVQRAGLTTRLRASHFLAQIMTETGGLQILEESGAYRAPRILKIFGVGNHSAGITPDEAKQIAALPVAQRGPVLFNRVYGRGNPKKMREFNNTGPNDGWLYRGGGMMQATGKSNYALMEKKTGLPLVAHPELLHQPDSAFMAAYLEWAQDGRCNAAADRDDVVTVRRIINGGSNGLAECRAFLAKAKKTLADYGGAPVATMYAEPEPVDEPDAPADPVEPAVPEMSQGAPAPAPPIAIDPDVVGDPELFAVQKRLKGRHYSPGRFDGKWGGGISGALSGFANDRHLVIGQPDSVEAFHEIMEPVKADLAWCEANNWYRPVSEERKAADPKVVAEVAPEAVPVKRSFWAVIWLAITSFVASVRDWISSNVGAAWDFFTDHKDDLPSDPGTLSTAWGYVASVPPIVWGLAACGVFIFIAVNLHSAGNKITESVSTGARQ